LKLLLVRHGETEGNVRRLLQGLDDPLTARGRRQAQEIAALLSRRDDVVAMYASPLVRTVQTARAISAGVGLEPVLREGLAELDVGDAEGLGYEEWAERFPEEAERFRNEGVDFVWPGGESGRQLGRRVAAEVDRIVEDHRGELGAVIIVSHGGALGWMLSHLLGEPDDRWPSDHLGLENCSLTEVAVPEDGDGQATVICKNEIGHLSPDPDAEVAAGDSHPG
jgi:broad specificity phosphatase PhoE